MKTLAPGSRDMEVCGGGPSGIRRAWPRAPGWGRGSAWFFEPARPDGGFRGQRVPVGVGRRHPRVKMRAAFAHQSGQPVAHERPKVVPSSIAPGANLPAKSFIAGINGIGPRDEFANPAPWQRLPQPHAGFLANGLRDNVGKNGSVQFDSRRSFHGCPSVLWSAVGGDCEESSSRSPEPGLFTADQ